MDGRGAHHQPFDGLSNFIQFRAPAVRKRRSRCWRRGAHDDGLKQSGGFALPADSLSSIRRRDFAAGTTSEAETAATIATTSRHRVICSIRTRPWVPM